jgi:hypothetical protein
MNDNQWGASGGGANQGMSPRTMLPSLIINGAFPLVIYLVFKNWLHVSEITALIATGIPPAIDSIVHVVRHRRIDFIAGVVLLSIAVGLALALLGGGPRLFLIRESFFTVAFGLAFLVSLLMPRPLAFYSGRSFVAGNDPQRIARYNALWAYPPFRVAMRNMTLLWGFCLLLEASVRTYLVFTLPVPQFLAVSPFVLWGIVVATFVFTGSYMRRWRSQHSAMLRQPVQ